MRADIWAPFTRKYELPRMLDGFLDLEMSSLPFSAEISRSEDQNDDHDPSLPSSPSSDKEGPSKRICLDKSTNRKCSLCGRSGHNIKTCPEKGMERM